jgi:dihydroorotate dehydrogenase
MLPRIHQSDEIKKVYADFKKDQRNFFFSPLGLAPGVCREDGNAVENLLEMGDLGFVELGPVTIDP